MAIINKSTLVLCISTQAAWCEDALYQVLDTQSVQVKRQLLKELPQEKLRMQREELKLVPGSIADPLRSLQVLPGIESNNDASILPYVRGGDWTETKVFWNGLPLITPFHTMALFSMFTLEGTENIDFYHSYLPAEGKGSLSGSIWANSRKAKDSLRGKVSIDLMRTGAWTQVPLGKNWNLDLSGQSFYYQAVLQGLQSLSSVGKNKQSEDVNSTVRLPTFYDLSAVLRYKNHNQELNWYNLYGGDFFTVMDQTRDKKSLDSALKADTIALVRKGNSVHKLEWIYKSSSQLKWVHSIAGQYSFWRTQFSADTNKFALDQSSFHAKSEIQQSFPTGLAHYGLEWNIFKDAYYSRMSRAIYKLLSESNPDPMDMLGQFNPEGFVLKKEPTIQDLSTLKSATKMDYIGSRLNQDFCIYGQWSKKMSQTYQLNSGLRLEYDLSSQNWIYSPRMEWKSNFTSNQSLTLSSGLYGQKDFPFYYRAANRKLVPEKNWSTELAWAYAWNESNKLKISTWAKKYWDLVSISSKVDSSAGAFWNWELLSAAKSLIIQNTGSGSALGAEVSMEYQPLRSLRGRISFELGSSHRRDQEGGTSYPFPQFRDWKIKAFQHYMVDDKHSIGLRYQISRGLPYTGFWQGEDRGDTSLIINPRLSSHYSPYQRLDLRLARKGTSWGLQTESYFEVWNVLNQPNASLRDEKTMAIQGFDFNTPLPVLFGGWEIQF